MLLIAPPTSYRISAYYEAAKQLGVRLVVASQGEHSLIPEIASGIHVDLGFPRGVVEQLADEAARQPFDAVIAADDATVELASLVAARLGLAHNPPSAVRTARRKDLARAALAKAGLPVPRFRRLDLFADIDVQAGEVDFPCVVKPLALSASRGVMRANSAPELAAACRRIAPMVATLFDEEERRYVLVESFLPGAECALEGILLDGRLETLAVFDKPDPLNGPFFEETYYLTPSRLPQSLQAIIAGTVEDGCRAYGLRHGPVHAELRLVGDVPHILEIAARTIGGDCARLLTFGTGASLEETVLRQALGEPVASLPDRGAAGVLMIPVPGAGVLRRVEGVMAAIRVPGIDDVVIAVREGYELTPLPEGGSYLGFIFARGDNPAEVEAALRAAHGCLNFVLAPVWHIEPGVTRNT